MMKYNPNLDDYWTQRERDSFYDDFGEDLKNFFNYPTIKGYVERNDWENIFDTWEYGHYSYNPHQLIGEVLAFFLYQIGVDFLPYLEDPKRFSIVCLEEE